MVCLFGIPVGTQALGSLTLIQSSSGPVKLFKRFLCLVYICILCVRNGRTMQPVNLTKGGGEVTEEGVAVGVLHVHPICLSVVYVYLF